MLAVVSVPPVYVTSKLDEGILCTFSTGKARWWWGILFLYWKETGLVFQLSKMPSKDNSSMSCCSNFFDDWHWDACICLRQLTGGLLFVVSSIQVARLLVYCVLIGSLAELLFSFRRRSVLAFLQMVDAITGKVMSSMVIVLALKVHCNTYLFHGFTPRMRSCSGLLSLLYSTAPGSD